MSDDTLRVSAQTVDPPEWLRKMNDDYWRTGCVRTEDLYRLLGDQSKGVCMTREYAERELLGLRP